MRSIFLLVLVGCSEIGLNDTSKGPELEFVQPVDGGRFNPNAPVSICAAVEYDGSLETLEVILVSDVGGTLASSGFIECDGGDLGIDLDLSAEPHVISMTVTDVQGRTATDTASIVPIENTTPSCSVITPMAGANLPLGEDVTMTIRLDDLEGGLIGVQVDSTRDGLVASESINGSGNLQLDVTLTGGTHDLVVTATDDRGAAGVCAVSIELVECEDADNDGFENCDGDCNDNDPAIYPGAVEVPDGQDNDCDGDIDEGTALFDDDGDGFTELDGDCDDTDPLVFPGQTEIPDDGIDQDCDGSDAITCFEDLDEDGYGSSVTLVGLDGDCLDPGEAPVDGDCDDTDPALNPGAAEIPGDGIDQDCDGNDPAGCFEDSDGDGFGSTTVLPPGDGDCDDPGESNFGTDCDDSDPALYPGAPEVLDDGIDQDCSGADRVTCYDDLDGDSFAGPTVLEEEGSCVQGSTTIDDCDDTDPSVNPNGSDIPDDGIDQDCSGNDAIWCFVDSDEDDYGSGAVVVALDGTCDTSDGESDNDLDCDDTDDTIYPGAPEVVGDGIDQDCSGADSSDCFVDADGDGYGTNATVASADADCDDPGEAGQNGDCRPGNPNINPGATEIPDNGLDDDCSGADAITCYVDNDGDGYGSGTTIAFDGSCDPGDDEASVDGDCLDTNPAVNPGATEIPDNGIDEDCSGSDSVTCYTDNDGDGYGAGVILASDGSCDASDNEASVGGDCADGDPNRFPGNPEIPDNGIDEDCSGDDTITCFRDVDQDGYGRNTTTLATDGTCDTADQESPVNGDCADNDPNRFPGNPEIPDNGIDEDCSGDDTISCFVDMDMDGYGTSVVVLAPDGSCDAADNEADVDGDCDDNNPALPDAMGNCGGACAAQIINPGDVIVTEVMSKPDDLNFNEGEWFEVYNTTGAEIVFCGDWAFEDFDSVQDSFLVDDPAFVLPSNEFAVFAVSALADPHDYVYDISNFRLSDNDEVVVKFGGVVIDSIAWIANPWDVRGISMQLDNGSYDHVTNDDTYVLSTWCPSTTNWVGTPADLGTPGEDNLSCP